MLKNYLLIALRNLKKHKVYSSINIFGLAIGLVCFILILLYVRYEFSYESQHIKANDIYRVDLIEQHPNQKVVHENTMAPLGKALIDEVPEVLDFTRLDNYGKTLVRYKEKKFVEENVFCADQGIFNLFTIPVIEGDLQSALINKYSIVLTESMAAKYFGNDSPVGQPLFLDNENYFTVTAVIKDFPENTNLRADFLISFNSLSDMYGDEFDNDWVTIFLETYVYIAPDQNLSQIEEKIKKVFEVHGSPEVGTSFQLEQFSRMHLYSEVSDYGSIQNIYLFLAIGILILLIASINFMNLSTARSAKRSNEVGLRKVVGANQRQLILQFLGESILVSFLSLGIALIIVYAVLPVFKELTEQDLTFPSLAHLDFYILIVAITLTVGLVSGSYPSFYLSSFHPASIIKGKQSFGSKGINLRRVLVVLQFSITIAFIISTISINNQIDFMHNKGLGFQKDHIVVVPVIGGEFTNDIKPFKQALLKNSNIRSATGSTLLPSRIGMYNNASWDGAAENESIELIFNRVDYDFLDTYEIELLSGRNFSPDHALDLVDEDRENIAGAVLLNEQAVRKIGWDNPIGKKVIQMFGDERFYFSVIGVIKDFHFRALSEKIQPLSLFLRPNRPRFISIKINNADLQNTIAYIENTWEKFNPEYPFNYYFLDENIDRMYRSEERLHTLLTYFSFLSILISCLGLFGLAAFSAEQRTKEIGVRKILGASISSVVLLLTKEFTRWVLIANIIAWPIAWLYLKSWLNDFAYRIDLTGWPFILSGFIALLLAVVTVSYQAINAARTNPADSLRAE